MRVLRLLFPVLLLAGCGVREPQPPVRLILWAWERPEDLRFVGKQAEIAYQAGFIELRGDTLFVRGRRHPLRVSTSPQTLVVHIQIDHAQPVRWTPRTRKRLAAAALSFAGSRPTPRVQIDFEVRASERQMLLDLLHDVRAGLPPNTVLSMTALASWCAHEDWLEQAPVDEVVPMLFRMGEAGESIKKRLENGGDFRDPKCRAALAISTDSPILRAPPGRRVYLFDPRSWNASDFQTVRQVVEGWQ